jgi:NitT/TauT family transport system permease protein
MASSPGGRRRFGPERLLSLLLLAAFLVGWELLVRLRGLPPLVLPGPLLVWQELVEQVLAGLLWAHLWVTLAEVLLGFLLGSAIGLTLGAAVAYSTRLGQVIRPYVVASQAMPKLALAPIMVVWFGFDLTPKIVIAALISFFPLFENMVAGLQAVEPDQVDLFRSLRANRWQTFVKLRLPSSIPFVAAGLRVALILSLVGAVVGEFVGANKGLGALIVSAQGMMDTPLMFAVFVVLTLVGIVLSLLADALERLALRWRYGE